MRQHCSDTSPLVSSGPWRLWIVVKRRGDTRQRTFLTHVGATKLKFKFFLKLLQFLSLITGYHHILHFEGDVGSWDLQIIAFSSDSIFYSVPTFAHCTCNPNEFLICPFAFWLFYSPNDLFINVQDLNPDSGQSIKTHTYPSILGQIMGAVACVAKLRPPSAQVTDIISPARPGSPRFNAHPPRITTDTVPTSHFSSLMKKTRKYLHSTWV